MFVGNLPSDLRDHETAMFDVIAIAMRDGLLTLA
jgi:hypothetical protein